MLMTKSEITVGDTGFGELVTFSLYSYIQNNKKSIFVQYLFLAGPAPYPQSLADGLLSGKCVPLEQRMFPFGDRRPFLLTPLL